MGLLEQFATPDHYVSLVGSWIGPFCDPQNGSGSKDNAMKSDISVNLVECRKPSARPDILPFKGCRMVDRISVVLPDLDKRFERLIVSAFRTV